MPGKADIKGIDRIQLFVVSLIAGFVPLVYSTRTLDPVMIPRMFLIAILTLALVLLLVLDLRKENCGSAIDVFRHRVFVFAILLIGLTGASCLKSSLSGESIFEFLKWLLPFIVLGACTLFFYLRPETVPIIARLVSLVALSLSIVGLGQYYGLAFLWIPGNIVPYATMANKNLFSSYLFLSLPWSFIVLGGGSRFWRLVSISSITISLLMIVLARTRAVWVAIGLTALIAVLLLVLMDRQSKRTGLRERYITRRTLIGSTTWLVLLIGLIYAADALSRSESLPKQVESVTESRKPSSETLIKRAESVIKARDPSVRDRLAIWARSLEMIAENPLMGVGPGQWRVHIAGYGTEGIRSETGIIHFQRPHNDYLWIAAESGVPAVLAFIAFLVTAFVYCWQLVFTGPNRRERLQALMLLLGLVGFMVISFFSYPKERPVHMTYLMLMVGLIISMYHRQNLLPEKTFIVSAAYVWPIITTILLATAAAAYSRIESEKHINRAYLYQERNNWAGMISEIDQAQTFFTPMDPTATPLAWYRGLSNSELNRNEAAFEDFKNAYQVNRNHLHVLTNMGTVYELKGYHDSAIVYYLKALRISPGFKDAALNLAAVYFNGKEYRKAYKTVSGIKNPKGDPRFQHFLERIESAISEGSAADSTEESR